MSNSSGKLKKKIDAFQARYRQVGLKITPQRMAVYRALIESKEHQQKIYRVEKDSISRWDMQFLSGETLIVIVL